MLNDVVQRRAASLGVLAHLADSSLLTVLRLLDNAHTLLLLGSTSRGLYALTHHYALWRQLAVALVRKQNALLDYEHSWLRTYARFANWTALPPSDWAVVRRARCAPAPVRVSLARHSRLRGPILCRVFAAICCVRWST